MTRGGVANARPNPFPPKTNTDVFPPKYVIVDVDVVRRRRRRRRRSSSSLALYVATIRPLHFIQYRYRLLLETFIMSSSGPMKLGLTAAVAAVLITSFAYYASAFGSSSSSSGTQAQRRRRKRDSDDYYAEWGQVITRNWAP